ncbi:hypothetical protein AN396_09905 [Candidatus Epulonipiscium fishelsonii]|uniref:Uncharacterized protein n=1 Tax=Candidatus Epulonipiscium fishelsonii TaxID=77094 RepID=A0ACC8X9F8_9FIRM|nr:hypothetical protein AN396_09905 [Epulopiscium sp. SCG-B11WGA-EpuloA1]
MIFKSALEDALSKWYKAITGRDLDLQNPKSFNEKIQWCKLYDTNPLKTKLTDKYEVRRWIVDKIGREYLVDIFGVYEDWNEIIFDNLPQQFVIKTTHGCNQNIIVKDKNTFDKNKAKLQIEKWLNFNYYQQGIEMQYKDIKPRIIVEQYLENINNKLYSYKFWCFNGKVEYIVFQEDKFNSSNPILFNRNWEKQDFINNYNEQNCEIEKPDNLDKMISIAEFLSEAFAFVSVDLYRLTNGTIKFDKMDFSPGSGVYKWHNVDNDFKIGQLFNIEPLKDKLTNQYDKLMNQYNKSKVIFFTPVYNARSTIERAYKSLVNQTDKNWIWHVVDDVSTDGTYELLQKLSNEDDRIILHRNKVNNVIDEGNDIVDIGFMYSDIDYLAVLDADDEYNSDFIIECKSCAIANNLDIVVGGYERVFENGDTEICKSNNKIFILTKDEKRTGYISHLISMGTYWGKLFKISTLRKINVNNLIYQHIAGHDTAFAVELFTNAENILILNRAFYKHYVCLTSKFRTWGKGTIDGYLKLYKLEEKYLLKYNFMEFETNKKYIQYLNLGLLIIAVQTLFKSKLTDYEKQKEILKIGEAEYIKDVIANESFDDWCNSNITGQKDIKKICFTLIKDWMLSQTDIEDDLVLEFCETAQLFCASMNDEEGWLKFKILHANALIELGNKMIEQGEQEMQELERMLS